MSDRAPTAAPKIYVTTTTESAVRHVDVRQRHSPPDAPDGGGEQIIEIWLRLNGSAMCFELEDARCIHALLGVAIAAAERGEMTRILPDAPGRALPNAEASS